MDCKNLVSQISAYLDGELDQNTSAEIKSHLKQCESCNQEINGQKIVDQSLRAAVLTSPIDSKHLRDRIVRSLPARRPLLQRIPLQWVGLGASIAAALLLVSGIVVFQRYKTPVISNKVLYADLVDDYLDHGIPPGLDVRLDQDRLKRQMARYQGVNKVMDYFRQQDYALVHTQLCTLDNTNFLHLIYQKNGRYLSVFFKPVKTPMLGGAPTEEIGNVAVHEWTENGRSFGRIAGANSVVLLIGEIQAKELHEFAGSTAPSLPVGMISPPILSIF